MKGMKQPSIQPLPRSKPQWHKHVATIIAFFFVSFSIVVVEKPVWAQEENKPAPAIIEFSADAATGRKVAAIENIDGAGEVPPLPFVAPQVGPLIKNSYPDDIETVSYTHLRAHETKANFVCRLIAYQGKKPIRAFIISSGLPGTPTVTGEFRIRTKVTSQTMVGGSGSMYYNLPGVKWVQYFYEDYGFHGTYWHNNFGRPMSHGCINMTDADAKWLFDWAGPVWRKWWLPPECPPARSRAQTLVRPSQGDETCSTWQT